MTDLLLRRSCVAVATGFYISYIPARIAARLFTTSGMRWTGSGFIGTLLGWITLPLLPEAPFACLLTLALGIIGASWIAGIAETELGRHDDSRIVIDEVLGYWMAVALLPRRLPLLLAGLLCFRLLDVAKPPPCGRLGRLPGGYGIVMDDIGAGVLANLLLRAAGSWLPL